MAKGTDWENIKGLIAILIIIYILYIIINYWKYLLILLIIGIIGWFFFNKDDNTTRDNKTSQPVIIADPEKDNSFEHHVYAIKTVDSKYYVGYTSNLKRRLEQHFSGICGAEFLKHHKPLSLHHKIKVNSEEEGKKEERRLLYEYSDRFGDRNVRGAGRTQSDFTPTRTSSRGSTSGSFRGSNSEYSRGSSRRDTRR